MVRKAKYDLALAHHTADSSLRDIHLLANRSDLTEEGRRRFDAPEFISGGLLSFHDSIQYSSRAQLRESIRVSRPTVNARSDIEQLRT